MNRYSNNQKLIAALEAAVARVGATGNVSVLPETSERAYELLEFIRHGNNYGYDIRNCGYEGVDLVHHGGYLSDVVITKELVSLDYNLVKHIEREASLKLEMLHRVKKQQEAQYWADVAAGLYD